MIRTRSAVPEILEFETGTLLRILLSSLGLEPQYLDCVLVANFDLMNNRVLISHLEPTPLGYCVNPDGSFLIVKQALSLT